MAHGLNFSCLSSSDSVLYLPLAKSMPVCTTILRRPDYSSRFRCIGTDCEDTCCIGWTIQFDKAICDRYKALPASHLRERILDNLDLLPENPDGAGHVKFANIRLTAERACPLLGPDRLCQIQTTHGAEYLSITCAIYPRIKSTIDTLDEVVLSTSCPEAARLVLLSPDLLTPSTGGNYQMTWDAAAFQHEPIRGWFWPIRDFTLGLITNRAYPLWQRMFLLGSFIRRLDAVNRGDLNRDLSALMQEFSAAIASGSLRALMATLPADLNLQLDMTLRLKSLRLGRNLVSERFIDTMDTFAQGIGHTQKATMNTLVGHYSRAYRDFYTPFFAAHPYILENLLGNTIFRMLFPFGRDAMATQTAPQLNREFALLALQFALIKGLLIGVAGFHREAFSAEHVVQTVQTVSKHFEHHPNFLASAYALLVKGQLDNPRGLTLLIRN